METKMEIELDENPLLKQKLVNFRESIQKIENLITLAMNEDIYEKLSLKEKIDHDLFFTYALNTLYWMYLRTQNVDPNQNDIKKQLARIKEFMIQAKQAQERQTIRPKLDQSVADRFVKHGISYKRKRADKSPPNKITKFSD